MAGFFSVFLFFFLCLRILAWGFKSVAVYNFVCVCVCVCVRATLTKQNVSNCLNFVDLIGKYTE